MDISLLFFPCLKSDKHLCLALVAWVLVRVAQEARDHSYFCIPSVVNKVHPPLYGVAGVRYSGVAYVLK